MSFRKSRKRYTDSQLVTLVAQNDEPAFKEILDRHQSAIYQFAVRFTGDDQEAEDISQETFLRLYRHANQYLPQASLRTYLLRITRNLCIDHIRKKRPETMEKLPEKASTQTPLTHLVQAQAIARMLNAVNALPENQRAVILLRHDQGLSYNEIAQTMDVSVSAVESLLVRARRTLRQIFRKEYAIIKTIQNKFLRWFLNSDPFGLSEQTECLLLGENHMFKYLTILIPLIFLTGCTLFAPDKSDDPPLPMPMQYTSTVESDSRKVEPWWESFDSPQLNSLVASALSGNFDVRSAWARLNQAQATAGKVNASLFPGINADAAHKQQWTQSRLTKDGEKNYSDDQSWSFGFLAFYELDLWGRLKSQRNAQQDILKATQNDLYTAAVTISAKVVETWIDILATQRKIDILKSQIQTNQARLALQKLKFSNGKARALDVAQQREALAAIKAELPLLELNLFQLESSLAVLTGQARMDQMDRIGVNQTFPPRLSSLPNTGLPIDLLANRPDIRAARLRLSSAQWEVSAARADRLPSFTLSAQSAFSSGKLNLIFDNWVNSLTAGITGPLFDGGLRKSEVERVKAVAEQRIAEYAKVVADSVKEVEDALAAEKHRQDYLVLLDDQLKAAQIALKDARLQYQNGQSDYLSYLTESNAIWNLELKIIGENANLIKSRIALYRALGGDWTSHLLDTDNPNENLSSQATTSNTNGVL